MYHCHKLLGLICISEIWNSQGGDKDEYSFLECDSMQAVGSLLMLSMNVMHSS
jgi:hypothetical protein